MATIPELLSSYTDFMSSKLEMKSVDNTLLELITESLGTAVHHPDASLVACSDKGEKSRIKENFLIDTLALPDTKDLDAAIEAVCQQMGTSNRKKFRVVFYYLLLEHFKLTKVFITKYTTATAKTTIATAAPVVEQVVVPASEVFGTPVLADVKEVKPKTAQVTKAATPAAETHEHVVDHHLLTSIGHTVGVNAYTDTTPVDHNNHEERERIKHHFLVGKLGLEHSEDLDKAIDHVAATAGTKNRAEFYYHLVKHFGKEEAITKPTDANLY